MLANGNDVIRPFSVSCSAVLPAPGAGGPVAVFFGGEVDPSDKGHEGAGGFSDAVLVRASRWTAVESTSMLLTVRCIA